MGDIVNMRQARKDRKRREADAAAQANRIAFGRTKAERKLTAAERDLETRRIEQHRISPAPEKQSPDE